VTQRVFEAWAIREDKPRWGDKTPEYVSEIPLLLQLFPEAQVIHIVRDGRDVTLSWLKKRYRPLNLYKAAQLWAEMVSRGRRDGSRLPASVYHEVRYETLLTQPEMTMRSICEFLHEPFDAAVLTPKRIRPNLRGVVFDQGVVTENTFAWKSSMSRRQRVLFESVAGDLLNELGYHVEGVGRKLSATERRLREADHQVRFIVFRLWKLRTPEYRRVLWTLGWADVRRLLGGLKRAIVAL
jgi:hypothetical protein